MKRQILVFSCLLLSFVAVADDVQTVTIGDAPVDKTVRQITFSGDDITLLFSDNSTQTADMDDEVKITFKLSTTNLESINAQLSTFNSQRVYDLRGRYMGESLDGLRAGVYIVNGKKVVIK